MSKETITIIDADSIIYMVAYNMSVKSSLPRNTTKMLHRAIDSFVNGILISTEAKYYLGYYADPTSGIKPEKYSIAVSHGYKANRPKEKDDWYILYRDPIIEHLNSYWDFKGISYWEADDYVAQAASKYRDEGDYRVVISAIDKDLLQVEGVHHHDYSINSLSKPTTEKEANYILYRLMIEGDSVDNYKGIPGLGKVAVAKLLKDCETEADFRRETKKAFKKWFNGGLLNKSLNKTLNEQVKRWKKDNPGIRLDKVTKEGLKKEIEDYIKIIEDIIDPKLWEEKYQEMYDLAKIPDTGTYKEDMIIEEPVLNKFYLEPSKSASIHMKRPDSISDMLRSLT